MSVSDRRMRESGLQELLVIGEGELVTSENYKREKSGLLSS